MEEKEFFKQDKLMKIRKKAKLIVVALGIFVYLVSSLIWQNKIYKKTMTEYQKGIDETVLINRSLTDEVAYLDAVKVSTVAEIKNMEDKENSKPIMLSVPAENITPVSDKVFFSDSFRNGKKDIFLVYLIPRLGEEKWAYRDYAIQLEDGVVYGCFMCEIVESVPKGGTVNLSAAEIWSKARYEKKTQIGPNTVWTDLLFGPFYFFADPSSEIYDTYDACVAEWHSGIMDVVARGVEDAGVILGRILIILVIFIVVGFVIIDRVTGQKTDMKRFADALLASTAQNKDW